MSPELTGILRKLAGTLPKVPAPGSVDPKRVSLNMNSSCPAECSICSVRSLKGKYPDFTVAEAQDILSQVSQLYPYQRTGWLNLWGGEPFADPGLLCDIARTGYKLDFTTVAIDTNGFWGRDINEALKILRELRSCVPSEKTLLCFSITGFHQKQPILGIDNIANIVFLVETNFPYLQYAFHSLATDDLPRLRQCLRTSLIARGLTCEFSPRGDTVTIGKREHTPHIIDFLTAFPYIDPCLPSEVHRKITAPFITPQEVAKNTHPQIHRIVIGINRQVFTQNEHFPTAILPAGNISRQSVAEIVTEIENHPILASLSRHGYSEVYQHLVRIFNFDAWLVQFYALQYVLHGLEHDDPFAAIGKVSPQQ